MSWTVSVSWEFTICWRVAQISHLLLAIYLEINISTLGLRKLGHRGVKGQPGCKRWNLVPPTTPLGVRFLLQQQGVRGSTGLSCKEGAPHAPLPPFPFPSGLSHLFWAPGLTERGPLSWCLSTIPGTPDSEVTPYLGLSNLLRALSHPYLSLLCPSSPPAVPSGIHNWRSAKIPLSWLLLLDRTLAPPQDTADPDPGAVADFPPAALTLLGVEVGSWAPGPVGCLQTLPPRLLLKPLHFEGASAFYQHSLFKK